MVKYIYLEVAMNLEQSRIRESRSTSEADVVNVDRPFRPWLWLCSF
jgi:hypothetical protein